MFRIIDWTRLWEIGRKPKVQGLGNSSAGIREQGLGIRPLHLLFWLSFPQGICFFLCRCLSEATPT
jgi:hypothetical protein